jgi:hypothetical protein
MAGLSLVDFGKAGFVELSYLPLASALSLSVLLILFGSDRKQHRKSQSGSDPADRSHPPAARSFSGRLFRSPMGIAQRSSQQDGPGRPAAEVDQFAAQRAVLPVLAGVGLALLFFFLQRISVQPFFCVSSWQSTPSRAAESAWR